MTTETFRQFIGWFGTFHTSLDAVLEVNAILQAEYVHKNKKKERKKERINQVIQLFRWFYSDLDGVGAAALLAEKPNGTFLVRLSRSQEGCPFTISLVLENSQPRICHVRIERTSSRHLKLHFDGDSNNVCIVSLLSLLLLPSPFQSLICFVTVRLPRQLHYMSY